MKTESNASNLVQIQTHATVSWFVLQPSEQPGHHNLLPHRLSFEIKTLLLSPAEPNSALSESSDNEILLNASLMII